MGGPRPGPTGPRPKNGTESDRDLNPGPLGWLPSILGGYLVPLRTISEYEPANILPMTI